jgi:hypothetical protein
MFALTGEIQKKDVRKDEKVPFESGSLSYHLRNEEELAALSNTPDNKTALEYIKMVKELELPTAGGISGTYDFSMVMAGLIGMGIGDTDESQKEREVIRMAYIGYFAPARHHTVHEVMQSSKTFGMTYRPGPGFEAQIYPHDKQRFISRLAGQLAKNNQEVPSYYLSKKYVSEEYERRKSSNNA